MTATEAPGRAGAAGGQQWIPTPTAAGPSYVPELGRGVVELLDPRPQERVLDLGCGDGALSTPRREAPAAPQQAASGVVYVTLLRYSKYDYFD